MPADPLFVKPGPLDDDAEDKPKPSSWRKNDHVCPFDRIAEATGLNPPKRKKDQLPPEEDAERVTIYSLRHSHITAQLLRGLPVQLVARLHDTSAAMLERHYAAAIASHADEAVRAAMVDFKATQADVVPIRGRA
jgi:integrase